MTEELDLARMDTPAAALYVSRASIAPGIWLGVIVAIAWLQFGADLMREGGHIDLSPLSLAWMIGAPLTIAVLTALAWFAVSRIAGLVLLAAAIVALGMEVRNGLYLSIVTIGGVIAIALGVAGARGSIAWHRLRTHPKGAV